MIVSAHCVEAPSDQWTADRVVVSVTDTGIGIPPEEWTRVFERFRRVESSRHRRRGAGLGLAICREVVTLYGGDIRVARSSMEGTTFEVDLPGRRTTPSRGAGPGDAIGGRGRQLTPGSLSAAPRMMSGVTAGE